MGPARAILRAGAAAAGAAGQEGDDGQPDEQAVPDRFEPGGQALPVGEGAAGWDVANHAVVVYDPDSTVIHGFSPMIAKQVLGRRS